MAWPQPQDSVQVLPSNSLSVIVPTFMEAQNIGELLERLTKVRAQIKNLGFQLFELIIVDDNSGDGIDERIRQLTDHDWIRLHIRKGRRDLSLAVLEGIRLARGDVFVVMDADLSHSPEMIPEMLTRLQNPKTDFVIGSRYISGGEVESEWSFGRRVKSRLATWAARPFTKVKDPMSGFFALRRETFQKAEPLNPLGYKIGLELIVKCQCKSVEEVPIFFADRKRGESKLSWREQWAYLRHLKRLADYRFGHLSFILQFGLVGLTGTLSNLIILTLALKWGASPREAGLMGIFLSMNGNFYLNRKVTFRGFGKLPLWIQYCRFMASCSLGAVMNYIVYLQLIDSTLIFGRFPQLAQLVGILAGMAFNYLLSRYWAFANKPDPHP